MQKRCLILLMSLCLIGPTVAYAASGATTSNAPVVASYDSATDYLSMMEECAQSNTPNSLIMGAILETQRNKKIATEGHAYAPTEFFNHFDGEKILAEIQEYKTPAPAPVQTSVLYYTENDVTMLAKVAYCESRGIKSKTEIACVMWTILNRLDSGKYGGSIAAIVTAPNQFAYYSSARTVSDYGYDLKELARDVLSRWNRERNGETEVGRVLPASYCWYTGDGRANHFRNAYRGGNRWNYSLQSPYEN